MTDTVNKQTGAQPCGTLIRDPTISVEGNRSLLTGVQPQGADNTPAQSPPLPQDPAPPLLPKRLQAKTMPRSSPCPYLFLSRLHKQVPTPLECALVGFRVTFLSQRLSSSGSGVRCSQPPCSVRETCAMLSWVTVESREAHLPREWLFHTCFREAEVCDSAFPVTVQL